MPSPVRVRFAPSPTGFLHLGGARTALFAWAYARHFQGKFILRIEDTDRERSTQVATQAILDSMAWLGLNYDEGPFYQMQRMPRYCEVIDDMLARGLAYRCYMPTGELDALREAQMARGEKPRYDGRWRPENAAGKTPPTGVAPVIRFRNPDGGAVAWDDRVKGHIEFANDELDDLVIARPDGTPTYNFCVVVDDIDMRITHVIRGDDHVNNTPRQINIFRALGFEPPVFAHVPTVLGEDGQKLSKRHGAVSVTEYDDAGYLPEAMINFLARLGWAHGNDEVFSPQEFCEWFDLDAISAAPSRFNIDKLRWLNQEHMKRLPPETLGQRLLPFLEKEKLDVAAGPPPAAVAELFRERTATLIEMAQAARFFYTEVAPDETLLAAQIQPANRAALEELFALFETLPWNRESLNAALKDASKQHGLKPPQIMMPMRALVAGTLSTPAIDAVLTLLGREKTRERLRAGLRL
ncbi:MAG: glutamate--tRNA ligase [Burkholderiales bacterium]|jgi:glutamyl-tRNA synthetase|nr:glutamate--tRNA ligase [Burkholderiales bacterium]